MAKHSRTISRIKSGRDAAADRSLTEQVYEDLKRAIVTAALAPGESINEPGLATRYGISKTPIREALRLLVQDGWVVILPRRGYLVRPLGLDDVREVFALRRMLEPALAAETARRRLSSDVDRLQEIVGRQASRDLDFDEIVSSAEDFHLAIAGMSGNRRSVGIVTGLVEEVVRLMHLMPRLEENLRSVTELEAHENIADAIARGDPDEAADLMRSHLIVAGRGMTSVFTDDA